MVGTLTVIRDHVKLAREYAMEGLYDTSIIFFDGAIAQINKHLTTLDDPIIRSKWLNCKKPISEEVEVVKQLDAEIRSFKEIPGSSCSSSPPIQTKSFVFQQLDEYPSVSSAPLDDPYVWRPPSRDTQSRNPQDLVKQAQEGSPKMQLGHVVHLREGQLVVGQNLVQVKVAQV